MNRMFRTCTLLLAVVVAPLCALGQDSVSGRVVDADSQPVVGATVVIENTTIGTSTDAEGRFRIAAAEGQTLLVSYLGYTTQKVAVGSATVYDVVLEADDNVLDEVVVVGYDVQKKVNLTGAVCSISADRIASRPIVSTSNALQGVAAGVTITSQTGNPGASGSTIRIRGIGSFGGSDCAPLVLVDGVQGTLDDIDPTQIDKISVLKDAASAAIYGSRAANGVILVTTKRGAKDSFGVTYRGYFGWSKPTALPKTVDAVEYMTLSREASLNDGSPAPYTEEYIRTYMDNHRVDPDTYPITDWQKEVLNGSGFMHNHSLTINASTSRIRNMTSFGYLDQRGIIERQNFERYTFRNNLSIDPNDKFGMRLDTYVSYGLRSAVPQAAMLFNMMNSRDPLILTRWSSGDYAPMTGGSTNILPVTQGAGGNKKVHALQFVGTAAATYAPVEGLVLEGKITPRLVVSHTHTFTDKIEYYADQYGTKSPVTSRLHNTLSESQGNNLYMTYQATASYRRSIAEDHLLKVLVGVSRETMMRRSFSASRQDLAYPRYDVLDAGADDETKDNGGSASAWALQSVFGRINYNYKERYLLECNLRYDGSSRFASGHRWGLFPSFSAAWRITEEPFMRTVRRTLTELKLRASYGQLGNQNISSSNYPFTEIMSLTSYSVNGSLVPVVRNTSLANPDITWETTEMYDVGLDATLWNKLTFTADWYYKTTDGILMQLNIPLSIGLNAPYQNAGVVRNVGWEVAVGYHDAWGDFSFGIDANLSDVHNEIIDMRGQIMTSSGNIIRNQEGSAINSIYGLHCVGMARTEAEAEWVNMNLPQFGTDIKAGDLIYADTNRDGVVNNDDKTIIGCAIPRYTYGVTLNFGWKGLFASAFFQGVGKADSYLSSYYVQPCINGGTFRKEHLNRWTPQTPGGKYPRMSYQSEHNRYVSDFWMADASYLRLKSLQIGYSFPRKWLQKIRLKGLTVFATAENLFTWTDFYQGYDPEVGYDANVGSGVALGDVADNYPQVKTYTFGVELKF